MTKVLKDSETIKEIKVPKVKIESIDDKSYPVTNSNFGIKYENII